MCSNSCPSTGWYSDAATNGRFSHGKEGTDLRRHGWILIFCRRFTKFIKFLLSGPTLKTTLFSRESVCAQSAETDRVHKHQCSLLHVMDGWWCGRKRGSRDAGWKNEKAKRTNEGCGRTDGGHDGTYGNWGVSHIPRLSVDALPGKQLINTAYVQTYRRMVDVNVMSPKKISSSIPLVYLHLILFCIGLHKLTDCQQTV